MYDKVIFQDRLKNLIAQRGTTQRILAEKLGTTETTISRYVSGQRTPNLESIVEIAKALNVSLDTLVGVEPPLKQKQAPDLSILLSCYEKMALEDRKVLWAVLDRYLSPEQRIVISSLLSVQTEAGVKIAK